MTYRIEIKPSAERDIRGLERPVARRVLARLSELKDEPRPPGVTKLQGDEDLYRARVGSYRIVYAISDRKLLVLVVRVRHRGAVYR